VNFDGLLFGVVNAAAFMLSVGFLVYVCFIVIPFLRHKPGEPGDADAFAWHFVVPCRDEERVIEKTVTRLRASFPNGHVWCIDDASEDRTAPTLRRLASKDHHVHVVTRFPPNARTGKGPALNSAWLAIGHWLGPDIDTGRVIVGVIDADGLLDPECLRVISGPDYFGDPTISAVQTRVRVNNDEAWTDRPSRASRLLVRMQDLEFTTVIAAMQVVRHHLGSVGMGGNGQFTRLSALNLIARDNGYPWQNALVEDFELGLQVLLSGGRNEYCHDTWVSQQGPATFRLLARQRTRWGQGMMQCLRYLTQVLRSPRIPTGAAVEITYFLTLPWVQVIGDLVFLAVVAALIYAVASDASPFVWLGTAGTWQVFPMFAIFGIGPLFIWGPIYRRRIAPELTRWQAIGLGLANWPYTFVHHVADWWALFRMIRSRTDWKKTERFGLAPSIENVSPTLAPVPVAAPISGPVLTPRADGPHHLEPVLRPLEPVARHRDAEIRISGRPVRPLAGPELARPRVPSGAGAVVSGRMQFGPTRVAGAPGRLVRTARRNATQALPGGPTPPGARRGRADEQWPPRSVRLPAHLRTASAPADDDQADPVPAAG
jgi:1,2-diacylglycerol 3-beta-glucosyltransferase